MSRHLDYATLQRALHRQGHPFYDRGDYNLNLVGIRTADRRSELFNDWIVAAFRVNDYPQLLAFHATTDPGVYWREHPMHVDGTAIVCPGHYPKLWSKGLHQGKYPALVQTGHVSVYRDANCDEVLDCASESINGGHFGINLHRAGRGTDVHSRVGKWSAGCQVIRSCADFDLLMAVVNRAAIEWGPEFSYTLLEESQLWD